jgi:hypothetical protein
MQRFFESATIWCLRFLHDESGRQGNNVKRTKPVNFYQEEDEHTNPDYHFHHEDDNRCRVYYTKNRRFYCYQLMTDETFEFYACSRNGEPEYRVYPLQAPPLPPGTTDVGLVLASWLESK